MGGNAATMRTAFLPQGWRAMEFKPLEVKSTTGDPLVIDVCELRVTGCFGIQRYTCPDCGQLYRPIILPAAHVMQFAFDDPDRCRDALMDYWTRLSDAQREVCRAGNLRAFQADDAAARLFYAAVASKADAKCGYKLSRPQPLKEER